MSASYSAEPDRIQLKELSYLDVLKNWIKEKRSQRNMQILSKKLFLEGITLWMTTMVLFYKNRGELIIYEVVGFSKLSKKHSLHRTAQKIYQKYPNAFREEYLEDEHTGYASDESTDKNSYDSYKEEDEYAENIHPSHSRTDSDKDLDSDEELDPYEHTEVLFDDDEEDNIEKRLWGNLTEEKKLEILDKELEDYFNAPRINDSEDEF